MTQDTDDMKTTNGGGDTSQYDQEDENNDMLNSESKTPLKTPTKEAEVKFIVADSVNGDAKIDMDHVKSGFSGMSKDELLKYVNDPFWVRIRTILFVLFWLIWIGLFVAAIAIIVMAPRCKVATPRKWYEEGPLIDINLPKDGKSLKNVAEKLDYFSDLKVKGLILSPVYTTDSKGSAIDFKQVSNEYGTLEELKNLLSAAKKKAIRVLLSMVPNHSSMEHEWFKKSIASEAPYNSYYVWAKPKAGTAATQPPNNWLTIKDKSAWTLNSTRNEHYLHQLGYDKPDLNFHNPLVIKEMTDILKHWLSLGVSGFNFDKVQYLLEDPNLKDEVVGSEAGPTQDQYKFWSHDQTYNYPGTAELISTWRNVTHSATDGDGIIVINGRVPIAANMNQTASPDLVRMGALSDGIKGKLNVDELLRLVEEKALNVGGTSWPAIETIKTGRHLKELGEEIVDPLNMVSMLLPGTPITQFGDEQGLSGSETKEFLSNTSVNADKRVNPSSHFHIYKTLSSARDSPSILYGAVNVSVVNDTFVLARWKAGNPGFVAVWNSSPDNITVDLSFFAALPEELTIVASGDANKLPPSTRVPTSKLYLPPYIATFYTFVPGGQ